jgi:hypothetical protein
MDRHTFIALYPQLDKWSSECFQEGFDYFHTVEYFRSLAETGLVYNCNILFKVKIFTIIVEEKPDPDGGWITVRRVLVTRAFKTQEDLTQWVMTHG